MPQPSFKIGGTQLGGASKTPLLLFMQNYIKKEKIILKGSVIYRLKILEIQDRLKIDNPIYFISKFCNLRGPQKIFIIHKPLKFAANFEPPPFNKILLDFRNSINYIFLCIAHEYTHILLRYNKQIPYPFEQSLAILLQLTYEDSVNIRKFKKNTIKELMEYMNVWQEGKILFEKWPLYINSLKRRKNKYRNILDWLSSVL